MRRRLALLLLGFAAALGAACGSGGARVPEPAGAALDRSIERGAAWLLAARGADGAWRSTRYRVLEDGWSLTLPAAKALAYAPDGAPGATLVEEQVRARLVAAAGGALDEQQLDYPVYSASLAVIALARASPGDARGPGERAARDAWLEHLARHQFTAAAGWPAGHPSLGGFGVGPLPPRPDGLRVVEADLSSTMFALGALAAAGVPRDDARVRAALAFVLRCQNLPGEAQAADARFDDGGFCLSPSDAGRNKAGEAGVDARGRPRFRSYASATADGLRALLAAGLAPDDTRVLAARRWLELRFDPERNAGDFPPERATERDASYYYAMWSTAHAFARLGLAEIETARGRVAWADELARALAARQRADGSFANGATVLMEDDPLVATPLALGALATCRLVDVLARSR